MRSTRWWIPWVAFVAVVVCVLWSGCTALRSQAEIVPMRDEFSSEGWTGYALIKNALETEDGATVDFVRDGIEQFYLGASVFQLEDESRYSINVLYSGPDWIFVDPGETLILLIDGERVALSGEGSSEHRRVNRGSVSESPRYDVEAGLLVRLAAADEVKVRLRGSEGSVTRQFGKANFKIFQEFVARFCGEQ